MARLEDKRSFKAINFDDADEYLAEGDTRGMLNVRVGYSESGDDGIVTNVKGTTSLFTELSFSLPAGINKCVATCNDDQNSRLIWFNYNSNDDHGIYCYNTIANTISTILASSILNFSGEIIHSVDILNNNLAWVDENRPRAINVTSALAGDLGAVTIEEQINDAKVVPMLPPVCTTTVTQGEDYIKSLKSFQFIYRYVFIDGEKGAWSTVSKLVPTGYKDNHISKITLDVSACELFTKTPLRNIIEFVEFASRELYTFSFNQFLRITATELVNDLGIVEYFDTESKTPVDTTETNTSFYENPIKAGSVCFQNDRKFYADCTEGYDAFSLSPSLSNVNVQVIPASGGIPYLSDCDTHTNDRYLKPGSEYGYSVEFKDKYARKSGAVDLPELTIKTQDQISNDYKANVLQFGLNLTAVGSYPTYADTIEILRSDNKTVTFFVQGRVNNIQYCTGYDTNGDPVYLTPGGNPAGATNPNVVDTAAVEIHLDISNWSLYDTNIGYTFTEGDRVTFFTIGGTTDASGSNSLKGLRIKELLGSKLVVDYPELGRTNLNEGTMAWTKIDLGAGFYANYLSRFMVGDNGVALISRLNELTSGANVPVFPFTFSNVEIIEGFPTTSNNLNAVCVIYSGTIGVTSIDVYIVGDSGYFIKGNYNPQADSFSSWNTIATGITTDINYIENDWVDHGMADLIMVGAEGVILKYNIAGTTITPQTSGVTTNLNCVFRDTSVLIAVGDDGVILRSTDNGDTWTLIDNDLCQNLNAIYKNGSNACIVGDEGVCLMSSDAGLTWTYVPLSTKYNLYTVDGEGSSSSAVYIGGENGYIGYASLSLQRFVQTYDPGVTKDINRIFSFSTGVGGNNDIGFIVGELDLLLGVNFVTSSFTNYSSFVADLYGSLILNYAAKIEVYSPKTTSGPVIYYETGDAYKVGQNYTFDKGKGDGDVFLIKKDFKGTGWTYPGELIFSMTPDSNNTSGTWDKDFGRPNTVLLYPEKQQRRSIIRYSEKLVQDSNINGLSNFTAANYEPIPSDFGFVRKITPLESILLINGERETGTAYIDQTIFKSSAGTDVAAVSDQVINNVRKLAGGFGCSHPESIVQYLGFLYFYSSNKASVCRYNNSNGIFPISEYKARTYFNALKSYILSDSVVNGGFEPKFKNYLLTLDQHNLFTDGDNGTFQDTVDPSGNPPSDWGITLDPRVPFGTQNISSGHAGYSFSNSIFGNFTAGVNTLWTSSSIAVDQNSDYVIEGFMYCQSGNAALLGSYAYLMPVTSGVTYQVINKALMVVSSEWVYTRVSINTGSNSTISIKAILDFDASKTSAGGAMWWDSITFKKTTETIAFQEGLNRWISKYSFIPERYGYSGNEMFSFLNGELWKHNSSATYNNFYGVQYTSQVNPVFNIEAAKQKNFTYISVDADKVWAANPITTQEGQETFILKEHFEKIQNEWFADIKQDINTPNMASEDEALINGDFIQSNTLNVLLETQASGSTNIKSATVFSNTINR